MFTSLKRIIKGGWINFWRHSGISLATSLIMVMITSLITLLFLFYHFSQYLIFQIQEKVDISVYFKEGVSEEEILKIKEKISQMPEVEKIEYISNKEAIEKLIKKYPGLLESVKETEGILNLASLNIKTAKASQYAALTSFLEESSFKDLIKKIDYYQRKPIIEKIFSITDAINRAGIILAVILGIVVVLLVFNQVRMAIYASKEEILIQRLVGASNYFIRGPFLVQTALSGIFAIIITFLIFGSLLYFLENKTESLFPGLNIFSYFVSHFWTLLIIQIAIGVGLGVISGFIAIRKYLKV